MAKNPRLFVRSKECNRDAYCRLSFSVYMVNLENWSGGILISGRKISNLQYAGDTTLVAATEKEILVKTVSERLGLCINISTAKTKVTVVDWTG